MQLIVGAMKDGIDLDLYESSPNFLSRMELKKLNHLNNNFNVDLHEAVAKVPVEDE